jgi:hypothetical protein
MKIAKCSKESERERERASLAVALTKRDHGAEEKD